VADNQTLQEKSLDSLQKQIKVLFDLDKYEMLLETAGRALSIDPNDAYTLHYVALTYERQNKYDESLEITKTLLAMDADEPNYYSLYGYLLERLEKHQEAIVQYEKAIELDPNNPKHYQSIANSASYIQDKESQDRIFPLMRKAIELDPTSENHQGFLAILLMNRGFYLEAQKQFLVALQLNPSISIIHSSYAQLLFNMGELAEARRYTDQSLQLNPMDPTAHATLPYLEKAEADPENYDRVLIKTHNSMIRDYPNLSTEPYIRMTKIFLKLNEKSNARLTLRYLQKYHPGYTDDELQYLKDQAKNEGFPLGRLAKNSFTWMFILLVIAILWFIFD
jgi:tetratricopeptide (TPR) repeat protein